MISIDEALKVVGNYIFHLKQADASTLAHLDEESHFSNDMGLSYPCKLQLLKTLSSAFGVLLSNREISRIESISDLFKLLLTKEEELKLINQNIAA